MRKSEGCWCQGGPLWLAETLCFTYPPEAQRARTHKVYTEAVRDEVSAQSDVEFVLSDDIGTALVEASAGYDLVVLGLSRVSRSRKVFGEITRRVIADTTCAALVISEDR